MTHNDSQRRLVLRVNELFHDLENEEYAHVHPEIFDRESERWKRLLSAYMPKNASSVSVLDIGTGTGFVSVLMLDHLKDSDTLTCTDISAAMLAVCERTIRSLRPELLAQFMKTTDERLPLPDASVDVVTLNSVLHHIPEWTILLEEIRRVLKPGGVVFIGHEPNDSLFRHPFLLTQARIIHQLTPKRIAAAILKMLGMYDKVVPAHHDVSDRLGKINEQLLAEQLIAQPLTSSELSALIDIHSPTAGSLHQNRGFSAEHLFDAWKDHWEVLSLETYNHLLKMSAASPMHVAYDRLMRVMFPHSGSIFFLVARKKD